MISGRFNRRREVRWWNEIVWQIIKEKRAAYKKWQKSGVEEKEKHTSKSQVFDSQWPSG